MIRMLRGGGAGVSLGFVLSAVTGPDDPIRRYVALAALRYGRTVIVASLAAAALLAGCGDDGDQETSAQLPEGCESVQAPAPKDVKLAPPGKVATPAANTAVVETNCGTFEIALDTGRAPKTTSSFVYQVDKGVYDGTLIHRIEPNFVIQGGDPKGDGTGNAGYTVDELPPQNLAYTRGTVAMAKSAVEPPGRSGSQFFVVTAADAGLSPDYALLGKVSTGFDVVQRISELGSPGGRPLEPVVIDRITLKGAG
jgi:peptidyl-prolyl cis-trans isomerase B (cyclophilin B)